MQRKFFSILLISSLVFTGCLSKNKKDTPADLRTTSTSKSVQTPVDLNSFDDIDSGQIGDTIDVNGDVFALVQRPSLNIALPVEDDFELQFTGVLKRIGDDEWIKFAEVEDVEKNEDGSDPKNNPIAVWDEKGALRIAVVDQNGAGSGEGIFKVFVLKDNRIWVQESCGYYLPEAGDFYDFDGRLDFEYFQYNSIAKSYQSGPTFVKEVGEERMINEPFCDNAFVSTIR